MAGFALQTVTSNRRRHDELQRFMLTADSVTVAVEVPIFLALDNTSEVVTGHIDFLQIRNGTIHILDYKPGARHEKPIAQLMTYALALSQRTGLDLFNFICAWFDEDGYFEFYPRQVARNHRRVA